MIAGVIGTLERTGNLAISWISGSVATFLLIGSCVSWCLTGWLYGRPVRLSAVATQIVETGLKSLPLIFLFAVSIGTILSIQIVDLVESSDLLPGTLAFLGHFSIREEGPLIAGIIMAARIGGALASELSSMSHDKELTALRGMGIDPIRFLVAPAFVALLITAPMITLLLVAGELLTISLYLFFAQGVQPIFALGLAVGGISGVDLSVGLIKGLCFGVAILGVSTQIGLNAASLGRRTGSVTPFAIVVSITAVLLLNVSISLLAPD